MQGIQAKAIDLLLENNISKFPIDPQALKLPGKSVLFSSYESLPGLMESLKNKQKDIDFCAGLTIETKKGPMILFSGNAGSIERRETITHELAHYLCGHGLYAANTEAPPAGKILQMQQHKEAEEFKCALLAPSAVLYQMGVDSIEEIQAVAGVSVECAEQVMLELQRRRTRRDPFYSYQERRLCTQFKETIEQYRAERPVPPQTDNIRRTGRPAGCHYPAYAFYQFLRPERKKRQSSRFKHPIRRPSSLCN